jgi:hypothetical protein
MLNWPVVPVVAALVGILLSIGPQPASAQQQCKKWTLVCHCGVPPGPPKPPTGTHAHPVSPTPCPPGLVSICRRAYRC